MRRSSGCQTPTIFNDRVALAVDPREERERQGAEIGNGVEYAALPAIGEGIACGHVSGQRRKPVKRISDSGEKFWIRHRKRIMGHAPQGQASKPREQGLGCGAILKASVRKGCNDVLFGQIALARRGIGLGELKMERGVARGA
jgi:hypothetical protein